MKDTTARSSRIGDRGRLTDYVPMGTGAFSYIAKPGTTVEVLSSDGEEYGVRQGYDEGIVHVSKVEFDQ